jgi:hypothetical protein
VDHVRTLHGLGPCDTAAAQTDVEANGARGEAVAIDVNQIPDRDPEGLLRELFLLPSNLRAGDARVNR